MTAPVLFAPQPRGAITATLVAHEDRSALPHYFGAKLTQAELLVYRWMNSFCRQYTGGYWHFYKLSNGGLYMAPACEQRMRLAADGDNGIEEEMSADAAGIVACLSAFRDLAQGGDSRETFIGLYHQLRDYAASHLEASPIFRVIGSCTARQLTAGYS
jgi:hypothetical protein